MHLASMSSILSPIIMRFQNPIFLRDKRAVMFVILEFVALVDAYFYQVSSNLTSVPFLNDALAVGEEVGDVAVGGAGWLGQFDDGGVHASKLASDGCCEAAETPTYDDDFQAVATHVVLIARCLDNFCQRKKSDRMLH
jgi:hypothetical protein